MENQRKDMIGLQPTEPDLLYQKPTNHARRTPMEVRVNNFWKKSSAGINGLKHGAGLSDAAAIVYRKPPA